MKRKPRISDLERRAYHEAGHLVAQYRCGIKTKSAKITPETECPGQTSFQIPRTLDLHNGSLQTQKYIDECVMSTFAGAAAEKRIAGVVNLDGFYADLHSAVEIGALGLRKKTTGKQFMAYLAVMERGAQRLIDAPETWRLVQVLAKALLKERFMWGKHVRQLIERELRSHSAARANR